MNIIDKFLYKRKLKMLIKERDKFIKSAKLLNNFGVKIEETDSCKVYIDKNDYWGYTTFTDARFDAELSNESKRSLRKATELESAKMNYYNKMIKETSQILNQ